MSNSSLRNGDFYVTKHSNLCEIHVLFHMVADDSVMSAQINSRHPVVMGLRHVVVNMRKCAKKRQCPDSYLTTPD